jgi:hypothetical protein
MISVAAKAQPKSDFAFFTDRNVYASGEVLLAKIFTPESTSSRIVSLDLVNLQGTRINGVSLEIRNKQADGFLLLPDSLSSGTYLVRVYLKNTTDKIVREIWISNRFDGLTKTKQINRVTGLLKIRERSTSQVSIEGLKKTYQPNETIDAAVRMDDALLKEVDGNLLVCIAQTSPVFESNTYNMSSIQAKEGITENKGIILSGTITDKNTLNPAPNVTVYLTIPDSLPGFQYYKTRDDGRFYFLLNNYYGTIQTVIQCFGNNPTQRLKIKLDSRFAESDSLTGLIKNPVSEDFKAAVTQSVDAVTFQKIFGQNKIKLLPLPERKAEAYPYYGKPSNIVDPQLFIDLPNFTEISRELLPGVKFRNYNNEPTLQVMNSVMRNYFAEQPLILIDGIPIRDLNVIKNMGTVDIDRVEICQSERFYGDLRFPGVVAIYTTKADYSRIPESDQLIRLKMETIQPPVALEEPEVSELNIPDLRQVIYWTPDTRPAGNISIKCRTSSVLGLYKLVVRGKLNDGTLFYTEKQFEVN